MESTEPSSYVRAQGTLDGVAFDVTDYWRLPYNPEHHHFSRDFGVLFDAPIGGACGLVARKLDKWGEPPAAEVATVDWDLAVVEARELVRGVRQLHVEAHASDPVDVHRTGDRLGVGDGPSGSGGDDRSAGTNNAGAGLRSPGFTRTLKPFVTVVVPLSGYAVFGGGNETHPGFARHGGVSCWRRDRRNR